MPSEKEVLEELKKVEDPHTGLDIVSMRLVEEVNTDENSIEVVIRPTNPFCPSALMIVEQVKATLESAFEGVDVDVKLTGHVLAEEEE
ncbi:metal-sulfur cluster assembly factor [Methanopyrus sp.]